MSRIKKILLSVQLTLLLTFVLAVPGFALDIPSEITNGLISVNGGKYFPIVDSSVSALAFPTSSSTFSVSSLDFFIPWTSLSDFILVKLSFVASSGSISSQSVQLGYVYPDNGWAFERDFPFSSYPVGSYSYGGVKYLTYTYKVDTSSSRWFSPTMYIKLHLDCNFSLNLGSSSGSAISLSPSSSSSSVSFSGSSAAVHATYNPRSSSTYWNSSLNLFTINETSTGIQYIRLASSGSTGNLYRMFADGDVAIPSASISASGAVSNSSYSGTISGNSSFLSPVSMTVLAHTDDSETVEQLQQINTTLDGMSSNLQTITDDFTAREDVGNDIGGTTSDSQISSGASGMSTGSASLSDGISGLPSFASIIAPTSGFVGFLTVPVQQIFEFANGYLLYIATAMVLLSVIFWIVKRMGGGDT